LDRDGDQDRAKLQPDGQAVADPEPVYADGFKPDVVEVIGKKRGRPKGNNEDHPHWKPIGRPPAMKQSKAKSKASAKAKSKAKGKAKAKTKPKSPPAMKKMKKRINMVEVSDSSDSEGDSHPPPSSHFLHSIRSSDLHELAAMSQRSRSANIRPSSVSNGYDGALKIGDEISVSRLEVDNLELFEDGEEPILFNIQLTRKQILQTDDVDKFLE
jgi:hypothetical protein